MKKKGSLLLFSLLFVLLLWFGINQTTTKWTGVDELVINQFAVKGGLHTQTGTPDEEESDELLLSVFLLAGALGGFVTGYYFRELFPKKTSD